MEHDREETIVLLRPHSIFIIWPLLLALAGLSLVVIVFLTIGASIWFTIAFFLWMVLGGGYLLTRLLNWYLNQFIFTNKRVIVKESRGVFDRLITEANLEDITDISYQVKGLWPTLFNYGDIFILTQNNDQPIVIPDIYKPGQIKDELLDLKDEILSKRSKGE
jgi:hypothetical protein